ncbi:MAG: hypothetical protein ACK2UC_16275 [Anaerolineae bacterium]
MIEVRLFGDLRHYADEPGAPSGVALQLGDAHSVGQVLAQIGIPMEEVGNLFLNGQLLPRSVYPITLGYPLASSTPLSAAKLLDAALKPGDRLGVFPIKMSLVVV